MSLAKAKGIGNPVIYVGAKTGREGIHGESLLASAEFTEESQQKRPNVQVGDPFLEKLLLEGCIEAMRTGAVVAIQDMGAAGLTCSTMEMASRGGTGIEIDLAKVPQRETGMTPYEIMLSESQERMLLVAGKGREHEVLAVFKKWGLDAVVVGQVTEGGIARIDNNGRVAAEIPPHPLAEEGPVYHRPIAAPAPRRETAADWFVFAAEGTDLTQNFVKLLASPAIASKRWITEQYDTSMRTNTLAGPGASDAAVVRIKDPKTGVVKRALALSTDGNGAPLFEHGEDFMLAALPRHQQHALLRFAEHDFVRGHAGFALGNFGEIDLDAGAAAGSHFHGGTSEAGSAHVLNRHDRAGLHGFEAGFEQQLLHEGIADLHVRAFLLRFFSELG